MDNRLEIESDMNTRAIILCAGEATRWGGYLDTPKHLINIEGERLLDRTVRLLRERGVGDIYIVIKEKDSRYEVEGAINYIADLNYEKNADADKFLSSKDLWSSFGRTIVFYGDCYFTNEAMDKILRDDREEWVLYCRPSRSRIMGSQWPECFAQSFYPHHLQEHEAALHKVAKLYKEKVISRCGGWEHYRVMIGLSDDEVQTSIMKGRYVEINDWTEDFDFPSDYDSWIKRRQVYSMRKRGKKLNIFSYVDLFFEDLILMFRRVKRRQGSRVRSWLSSLYTRTLS